MLIKDIRAIATERGLKTAKLPKAELIRLIQRSEGNFDCFGSATGGYCDQDGCSWREDCLPTPKKRTARAKSTAKARAKRAAPKKKAVKKTAAVKKAAKK